MKCYYGNGQLRLSGKVWEIRHYLKTAVKQGNVKLSDIGPALSAANRTN